MALSFDLIDQCCDGVVYPVLDPPPGLGGDEGRLNQGSVTPVLRTAHRQHAVVDAHVAEVEGVRGGGKCFIVPEGSLAGLVAERGVVSTVGLGKALEDRWLFPSQHLVNGSRVNGGSFSKSVKGGIRILGVTAARQGVVLTPQIEQLTDPGAVEYSGVRHDAASSLTGLRITTGIFRVVLVTYTS